MKNEDIIKAIAELDGWINIHTEVWDCEIGSELVGNRPDTHEMEPLSFDKQFAYLTSRDAIIPVIEKQIITFANASIFIIELSKVVGWDDSIQDSTSHHTWAWYVIKATPRQLCEALLRATGKWKE